jgi:hypothetical protein
LTTKLVGFCFKRSILINEKSTNTVCSLERRLAMTEVINAVIITFQMLFIFACAFYVVYLIARVLLPVERGLSKYIWDHADSMKPVRRKSSFKEFSKKHHH